MDLSCDLLTVIKPTEDFKQTKVDSSVVINGVLG